MRTFKPPGEYSVQENLTHLVNGVGTLPRGRMPTVAIVGAGIAGLTVGWLLARAGFGVTIFEASRRVGGRIRTLREEFSPGLYAEAGAMRIPYGHLLTHKLCEVLHLNNLIQPFPDWCPKSIVYVNGVHTTASGYQSGKANFGHPFEQGRSASHFFETCLRGLRKVFEHDPLRLNSISLEDYIRAYIQAKCDPITGAGLNTAIDISASDLELIALEFGKTALRSSLLEAYRDYLATSQEKFQIMGGLDQLPQAFLDVDLRRHTGEEYKLREILIFSARVIGVDRDSSGFRVEHEHSMTNAKSDPSYFDSVVLAAPFSALVHVSLEGVLSYRRRQAIRTLHYETATKIIVEFSKRWWEPAGITGGRSITDLPIRWVHYPSPLQHPDGSSHGVLLASYTRGEDSLRWGSLSAANRIRLAVRDLARLHQMSETELARLVVGGASHSWAEDEHTFGAAAIFEPHQEEEMFEDIWRPETGIHFAGEHTSIKRAWVEGAVESGIRTASEVFDSTVS